MDERTGRVEDLGRVEALLRDLVVGVNVLCEELRRCNEFLSLLVNRLGSGVVGGVGGGISGGRREGVSGLSEEEVRVLEGLLEWVRGRWREWVKSYDEGRLEGYDRKRDLLLLKKRTFEEFLRSVSGVGLSVREILKLLGDLGILKFWDKGRGQRQYCIAIRVDKPVRGALLKGYYVLVVERMKEVAFKLKDSGSAGGSLVEGGGAIKAEAGGVEAGFGLVAGV
jgi:hypothetical protein